MASAGSSLERVLFEVSIGSGKIKMGATVVVVKLLKSKIGLPLAHVRLHTLFGIMEQKISIASALKEW